MDLRGRFARRITADASYSAEGKFYRLFYRSRRLSVVGDFSLEVRRLQDSSNLHGDLTPQLPLLHRLLVAQEHTLGEARHHELVRDCTDLKLHLPLF